MKKITWPAIKVLAVIQWWYETHHMAPTYRELAEMFGHQTNAISNHISTLRASGLLANNRFHARSLVPTFTFYDMRESDQ